MYADQTSDGTFVIVRFNGTLRDYDKWIENIDAGGTVQWSKSLWEGYVSQVQRTSDDVYIIAARGTYSDLILIKTDSKGNEQWNKTFIGTRRWSVNSIRQTWDGGYILAGMIDTAKNPELRGKILYDNDDAWLFKTDASGNLEWSKTFGGLRNDDASFVMQTSDGGYIIAGTTESYGAGGRDLWLVKVTGMEVDFVQPGVIANNTSIGEVRLSDNNVTETLQSPPDKSIPGFEFVGAVFSVLVILFLKIR